MSIRNAIRNIKLSVKFSASFLIILLIFVGLSVYVGVQISEIGDGLEMLLDTEEEIASVNSELSRVIRILMIGVAVTAAISLLIAASITKHIKDYIGTITKVAERVSEGDLTVDLFNVEGKDEFSKLMIAVDQMVKNTRVLTKNMNETSNEVSGSSKELTATIQQSVATVEEVVKTIEEIAKSATDQAQDTETGVYATKELSEIIEEDLQDMDRINEATGELARLKDEGEAIIRDLAEKTQNSSSASKGIYESSLETNESVKEIGAASSLIQSIAEQTNLLALNAAIEAARAGEAGKGFSVVAEEIRKLAEQSTRSVKEIDERLEKLGKNSEKTVGTMEKVGIIITEQVESVKSTRDKFDGIAEQVKLVRSVVDKSVGSVGEMNAKKDELAGIMENLAAIAEENAAATQQALSTVEEQTSSMEEIGKSSEALTELAEGMQQSVGKFKFA